MVVGVVALRVAILVHMNEVAIGYAIDTHLHDGLVTHADLDAAVAARPMAVLAARVLAALPPTHVRLPHAILVVIVIRLAPRALRAQVLIQTDEAFLRALELGLLVGLHGLLFRVDVIGRWVSHVDFGGSQADHCNLFLPL